MTKTRQLIVHITPRKQMALDKYIGYLAIKSSDHSSPRFGTVRCNCGQCFRVEPVCSEIKINISLYQKYSGDQDIKTNLNKLNSKERDSAATQVLIICKEQNVWLLLLILICVSVQWLDSDELITQGKNQSDSNCSCVTQAVS